MIIMDNYYDYEWEKPNITHSSFHLSLKRYIFKCFLNKINIYTYIYNYT